MATFKTYAGLAVATTVQSGDLFASWRSTGPLKSVTIDVMVTYLGTIFAPINAASLTGGLTVAGNVNLSSSTLTVSSGATITAGGLTVTAGGATVTAGGVTITAGGLTLTGGVTQTGSTKQNVTAVSALAIDLSTADFFTKSISINSTFTFTNATASTAEGFVLELTITAGAVPTWPASVQWSNGIVPTLGNGRHVIGFITLNGGTLWTGIVGATATA